jgi:hypothetical protein
MKSLICINVKTAKAARHFGASDNAWPRRRGGCTCSPQLLAQSGL